MPRCAVSTAFSSTSASRVVEGERLGLTVDLLYQWLPPCFAHRKQLLIDSAARAGKNRSSPNGRIAGSMTSSRMKLGPWRPPSPRQQNAVAMVAGGVEQGCRVARGRESARRRGCPAGGRPKSPRSAILRSAGMGATLLQAAEHAAGGDGPSKTFSSTCRRQSAGRRAAAPDRRPAPTGRGLSSGAESIHAQRQHLALHRPHRRPPVRRQSADAARPRAGGKHHNVGLDSCVPSSNTTPGAVRPGQKFP